MKFITLAFILLPLVAFADNSRDITIPLPQVPSRTSPTLAKFDHHAEKIFIAFIGSEAKSSVVYDIGQRIIIKHCISSIDGDLAALSSDGEQFAVRIKSAKKDDFTYEIRSSKDCSVASTFKQPKLQYPIILPQIVFNTKAERAVFVEPMNPYKSGKAFFKSQKDLEKAGFSSEYGRVLFFDLKKKAIFNKITTPSEYSTPYISDDGSKLVLVQTIDNYSKPLQVFSTKNGVEINLEKDSQLLDLKNNANDSWQFWIDFFTSDVLYQTNHDETPDVDEQKKSITLRTSKGNRTISNFKLPLGVKFWRSVDDGKYVVVTGSEEKKDFVRMYSILGQ